MTFLPERVRQHLNVSSMAMLLCLLTVPLAAGDRGADVVTRHDETVRAVSDVYRNAGDLYEYPIGVFDSGTGGLTVLEMILDLDRFDNTSNRHDADGDGKKDFADESFIFLGDQANMPYGNYPSVGKAVFLRRLILKDAEFLLRTRYHPDPTSNELNHNKRPIKAIVIACNTATAYGKVEIERLLREAAVDIKVIGVVDSGAEGALAIFRDGKPGTIGVVPTRGTALSRAYPAAIRRIADAKGFKQDIMVVQQGAVGAAGAIDGAFEFIRHNAKDHHARADYRGPSLDNTMATIDLSILKRYDFDFSQNRMLYEGSRENPTQLQLNSVENYIAYHLVTLLEKVRASKDPEPLRAVILACTHFPFFTDTFARELERLYDYEESGKHIYRPVMAPTVELIDPAFFTARELYRSLATDGRLNHAKPNDGGRTRGEFYITVPCRDSSGVKLNENGWFTYEYKYGRHQERIGNDVRTVPMRLKHLEAESVIRLQRRVPAAWSLLEEFRKAPSENETP